MALCSYCEQHVNFDLIGKWAGTTSDDPDEHKDEEPQDVIVKSYDCEEGETEHLDSEMCRVDDQEQEAGDDGSRSEVGSIDDDPIIGDFDLTGRRALAAVRRDSSCCHFCHKILQLFMRWSLKEACLQDGQPQDIRIRYSLTFERGDSTDGSELLLYDAGDVSCHILQPRKDGGVWGPTFSFHKLRPDSLSVEKLLDECPGLGWLDDGTICARVRPEIADMRLFKKWSDWCTNFHRSSCCADFQGDKLTTLRVIDVEQQCLYDLEVTANSRWISLSFVWGLAPAHVLTHSNKCRLYQAGALNETNLPATIYDAMFVTQAMQEHYLWVDALCIIQDDDEDKSKIISRMDDIYSQAFLTIINAVGADARDFLPGVREHSARATQEPFDFKGITLLRRLMPIDSDGTGNWLGDSVWCTRGWTLQEGLLSPRALVFTADQVYWQCQDATWCEDSHWEFTAPLKIQKHYINLSTRDVSRPQLWNPEITDFDTQYQLFVREYTQRNLTDENDIISAIGGILKAIHRVSGESFLWAMPMGFIEKALTWPDMYVTRREGYLTSQSGAKLQFPSWSWVGWKGIIYFAEIFGSLYGATLGLDFYSIDKDGPEILCQDYRGDIDENSAARSRLLSRLRMGNTRTDVQIADLPIDPVLDPLARSLLCFWTSTATLEVVHVKGRQTIMLQKNGKDLFSSQIPQNWIRDPGRSVEIDMKTAKFAIVAKDDIHAPKEDRLVGLMLKYNREGCAERVSLASIPVSVWLDLPHRHWELVCLQ